MTHVETCGDYQPYTIAKYRGYTRTHFAFWSGRSIHEIRYDLLREIAFDYAFILCRIADEGHAAAAPLPTAASA